MSVGSGVLVGVDAVPVVVEATLKSATATPRILGSVGPVVREAYHRVLSAFAAQDLPSPRGSAVLNFLPADVRKSGSGFDLPMALALAAAAGMVPREAVADLTAFGELSLEGRVLPCRGVVPVAVAAASNARGRLVTADEDARLAARVPGVTAYGVASLREAIGALAGREPIEPAAPQRPAGDRTVATPDLSEIHGHETPKLALAVACAGRHNVLFSGPPGSGKSALARRVPALLPPPSDAETLDILRIASARGVPPPVERPFRAPHHTSSGASLLGGGSDPVPGEVSLAQHGVLFLDELPEFRREVLEGLRQPLEDRVITVGRVQKTATLPADFLLIAAMNPCPCGYDGCLHRQCTCQPSHRLRYRARVSGPLRDRFDLRVAVPFVPAEAWSLTPDAEWCTAALRQRVEVAQRRREARGQQVPNARLDGTELAEAIGTLRELEPELGRVLRAFGLSGRARTRVLRVARTLADLDDSVAVDPSHLRQASRLRGAD